MFRKVLLILFNLLFMGSAIIVAPIYLTLRWLSFRKAADKVLFPVAYWWARINLFLARIKLQVQGFENLPPHNKFCYITNHQSYFDIPVTIVATKRIMSYVAKRELMFVPFLNLWLYIIQCPVIDRNNRERSVRQITNRIAEIHKGRALVICPEGTRSRSATMKKFKVSGIHAIIDADVPIVPISISGTYKAYEGNKKVQGADVKVLIHPLMPVHPMNEEQKTAFVTKLENTVNPANHDFTRDI